MREVKSVVLVEDDARRDHLIGPATPACISTFAVRGPTALKAHGENYPESTQRWRNNWSASSLRSGTPHEIWDCG
jgi:hypothetical protein